ncbi:hypothetical protein [Mycolicibacterium komossense]|uniref:Uncharacterized protein n=1 Tax=Mycolicibacterium komossense TaxID=1779 RepID=A0ABT3C8R9_9MYCO|nr:hypothetical protein [Mycolicibacterium komossense]MCV7225883.1 hypothetical protein [Mycolicibacterium komossense]
MRFHWSAEPGIDLYSGPAVPIRAYSESFYIINLLADPDAGYPGFSRAISVPPDQVGKRRFNNPRPQGTSVISNYGDYVNKPLYGTMYLLIMRITPTPTGFSTLVCDTRAGLYLIGPDGKYVPRWKSTSLGPAVIRIDFTNQSTAGATAPSSPTAPQRGPLPAPAEDVFG